MEKRYIVHIVLLGFFLGFVLLFGATDLLSLRATPSRLPVGYNAIGVIDLSGDNAVNVRSISRGNDAVLVINPKWTGKITTDLAHYDANKDGVITLDDPVYPYLELFFYDSGRTFSLWQSGIRAIRVKFSTPTVDYQAIFSDGSIRFVRSK